MTPCSGPGGCCTSEDIAAAQAARDVAQAAADAAAAVVQTTQAEYYAALGDYYTKQMLLQAATMELSQKQANACQ